MSLRCLRFLLRHALCNQVFPVFLFRHARGLLRPTGVLRWRLSSWRGFIPSTLDNAFAYDIVEEEYVVTFVTSAPAILPVTP